MDERVTSSTPEEPTTLKWVASLMATAVYAAEAASRGLPLLETPLDHEFLDQVRELRLWISSHQLTPPIVWNHLGGLSADIEDPYELAARTATRLGSDRDSRETGRLGEILVRLKQSIRQAFPDLVQELAMRAGPLREQWEARGPGLLKNLSQQTGTWIAPESAEILLVAPLLGGGGRALLGHSKAQMEAVLVHADPEIPEMVRLAWLIAQLGVDRAPYRESIPAGRFPLVIQLALVPPVLLAAESVEWTTFHPDRIRQVLAAWYIPTLPNRPTHEWLLHWWESVRQEKLSWEVALQHLDKWLG